MATMEPRYLSVEEYKEMDPTGAAADGDLLQAEFDVDSLTFNRIRGAGGITELTELQQELVKRAVAQQADFRHEYAELLNNPLSSYGINGVSMAWDKSVLVQQSGVFTTNAVIYLLRQTGMTYRGLERRRYV